MLRNETHIPENEPTTDDWLEYAEWCREIERIERERDEESFEQTNRELSTSPLYHAGV